MINGINQGARDGAALEKRCDYPEPVVRRYGEEGTAHRAMGRSHGRLDRDWKRRYARNGNDEVRLSELRGEEKEVANG